MIGERLSAPIPLGPTEIPGALETQGGRLVRRVEIYDGPRLVGVRFEALGPAAAPDELLSPGASAGRRRRRAADRRADTPPPGAPRPPDPSADPRVARATLGPGDPDKSPLPDSRRSAARAAARRGGDGSDSTTRREAAGKLELVDAWLEVRTWVAPWARRRVLRAAVLHWRARRRPSWRPTVVADEQPIAVWMAITAWRMGGWLWEERTLEHFEQEIAAGSSGPSTAARTCSR